ncbi:MAG: hypothetical protein WAM39_10110 [Bryobacteraceae bacterium]
MNEWHKGLVYTARPRIPSPLLRGRQYRIATSFKRKIDAKSSFTGYGELYRRVTAVAGARMAELASPCEPLHTWIVSHGWRCLGDAGNIACAFLTMGLVCLNEGDAKPEGELEPTPAELMAPGGATLETLARTDWQRVDDYLQRIRLQRSVKFDYESCHGQLRRTCPNMRRI